jgi:hypothetical protein
MRILEHFFPDRELNLTTLREIAKDVVDGKITSQVSGQTHGPTTSEDDYLEDEDSPESTEPAAEALNDLHEPLGCMMKDSLGRYSRQNTTDNWMRD